MFFDDKEVENLRKVYNKEHTRETPIPKGNTHSVWKHIQKRLHDQCDSGAAECIINSLLTKPNAPNSWKTNPEEWLSSIDIDAVEKQFASLFSDYYYVGTVPIDFGKKSETGACIVDSLCSLNIEGLYNKGYRRIGIVFNTDVSTGPGQHWIALYCDIRPELVFPRVTFFDSYAERPSKEVINLMKRWKISWDATKIHSKPMATTYNKTRHQYENSECGMYCLYFHFCCLLGIPMNKRIPDEVVRGFRGVLFRI
jgi:hypothetical protein